MDEIPSSLLDLCGCSPGKCYDAAFALFKHYPQATLVHGIVQSQKDNSTLYGHAWLEFEEVLEAFPGAKFTWCFDTTRREFYPRDLYYRLGHIEHTKRYSYRQATDKYFTHRHPGPWDAKIKKAKHAD